MNKKVIVGFIIFVALILIVALFAKYSNKKTAEISPTPTLVPGTAGNLTTSKDSPTMTPGTAADESLKSAIKEALIAEHGQDASSMTITITENNGDFAKGQAFSTGPGAIWLAAKTDGKWKLFWDGNGIINCNAISTYPSLPKSMVSSCYDLTAKKFVTR